MYRSIARNSVPSIRLLRPNVIRPPPSLLRPYGTVNSVPKQNRVPFKSISASIALASSFYLYSSTNGIAEAEAGQPAPLSAFTTSSPTSTKSDLGDENSRLSVHSKSIPDLLLALFVYKLCTLPWLVDAAPHIISLAETLHMEGPVYWIIKQTFFRHFCGGETPEECVSTMDKLALSGINCILDLSVEADLHIGNKDETSAKDESPYSRDDQKADVILEMTKKSIKTAASGSKTNAMVATKITALSPPQLLLRLNQAVTQLEQKFVQYQINGTLDAQGLRQVIQILPAASGPEQEQARSKIVSQLESSQGTLDILEFRKLFNLNGPGRGVWWNTKSTDKKEVLLTNEELAAYDRVMNRLEDICSLARESNVGVMVDAEQSYFQDIIDHLAMNLQRKFNHRSESEEKAPTVFNTYQMYTKSSRGRLELDVESSHRENFTFAAKLVRGAYMISERKRAEEMGYPSPIHDTLEDTHASYNGGVSFLLSKINDHQHATREPISVTSSPIVFMVASHNRDSAMLTIDEMERNNVAARSGVVLFGQLYGMQDHISYTLANNGYSIYKYLPYGMIDEVIPYLLRRAQENSSVLGGVSVERRLMWDEVIDRLTGKGSTPATTADVSITGVAKSA